MRRIWLVLLLVAMAGSAVATALVHRRNAFRSDTRAAIQESVIVYYPLNESSNSDAADDVGPNNLDASQTNTPGTLTGQVGGARKFVEISHEYFLRADNDLFTPAGNFTVTALIRLTSKTNPQGSILTHHNGVGNNRSWIFCHVNAQDRFRLLVSDDGIASVTVDANALGAPALSTWYFVAGRYDGANIEINATALSSENRSPTWNQTAHTTGVYNPAVQMSIGAIDSAPSWSTLDGDLDEVGFFNRDLDDSELDYLFEDLYKNGLSLYE